MKKEFCECPYIPCPLHDNCRACIAKNQKDETMCFCMEETAENLGASFPLRLPKTVVVADEKEVGTYTAELIENLLAAKPDALLCFAAGMTSVSTCQALVNLQRENKIDFQHVKFVSLDEWLDLEDTSENCSNFLRRHLYGPLGLRDDQMCLFNQDAPDLEEECKRVDNYIFTNGGIDFMTLGLGMNGHLGLNEPGDSFNSYSKVVELSDTTRVVGQKYFSEGKSLSRGITLGVKHFFETQKVILQVCGEKKQDIVEKVVKSRPSQALPGTVIKLLDNAELVLDKAAAGKILDLL